MADLTMAGIFAGIGGFEIGFRAAGFRASMLSEIDPAAQSVLTKRFPEAILVGDVRQLYGLGSTDILCAGFPCQDLSQAGATAGIEGGKSGIIREIFRAIRSAGKPRWVILENVPFMLHLAKGAAINYVIDELEALRYRWAYRVIDSRSFGLPQRRRRVYIVASLHDDPRGVLFNEEVGEPSSRVPAKCFGFYWTEGNTGLGWASNAIPTLKGGSGLGIPSPPAIWIVGQGIFLPDIRDAERLQGFRAGWTNVSDAARSRWRLVGNAVSVPVAHYIANRLIKPDKYDGGSGTRLLGESRWPMAAWGSMGKRYHVERSAWPIQSPQRALRSFLKYPLVPLSRNAAAGFLRRANASSLRFHQGFLEALNVHIEATTKHDHNTTR
ncbi:MAG TPA: DNA (cytosine-5-)-methyltransferase [Acidobacteriaceae bacterium]|jgi:DNA (cytosine-5)-methyltransferase 1|nr:DNA (cytosine-5-)-methyltransferase [Acidobacteriaceae bacterium]